MARTHRALASGEGSASDIKVFLDPNTKALISQEAEAKGVSKSQYCRDIIETYIDWMLDGKESEFQSHLAFARGKMEDLEKAVQNARDVLSKM